MTANDIQALINLAMLKKKASALSAYQKLHIAIEADEPED